MIHIEVTINCNLDQDGKEIFVPVNLLNDGLYFIPYKVPSPPVRNPARPYFRPK